MRMLRHPAVIALICAVLAWLVIVAACAAEAVNDDDTDEPTGPPTSSITDCWPDWTEGTP